MTVEDFVKDISRKLKIDPPKIVFVNQLRTKTQLAEAIIENGKSTLKVKRANNDLDVAFAIIHECRHIFQAKYNTFSLGSHVSNVDASVENYNMQPEEIDANAFATKIMSEMFGVKPLFDGLDEDIKSAIYKAANELEIL